MVSLILWLNRALLSLSLFFQSVWQRAAGGVGRECMRTTSDEETFFFRVSELRHLS